jgi:hypothetical protein
LRELGDGEEIIELCGALLEIVDLLQGRSVLFCRRTGGDDEGQGEGGEESWESVFHALVGGDSGVEELWWSRRESNPLFGRTKGALYY